MPCSGTIPSCPARARRWRRAASSTTTATIPAADTPALLGAYRGAPLLVLAGREDRVVPDLIAKMAGVKNPRIGFAVIEEADHMFLDFYAEDVADRMAEFLEDKFR